MLNETGGYKFPRTALRPKLFTSLKHYSRRDFFNDLTAGAIVGVVALPLAIAFAIASGVSPEKGLITAVVAGFLISAFSGSRVQIGGPTGAFVVIVYGIVQKYGLDGLMVSTFMAGVILIIMGVAGFGTVIKFIPRPVTVGFTSGIAVIIFSSQIRDFFGLQMLDVPAEFFAKWEAYAFHWDTLNVWALAVSLFSAAVILYWPRVSRKVPGSLIALVVSTAAVRLFHIPVETIAGRFGSISSTFPTPHLPDLSWELIRDMVGPATTIALLAGIESLLSATVADGMIGGKHRSNMELVAQGIANLASPLFGGIPATGAIARTATNVKNGGRTPIAGIVHALVLLLIMLVFGRWAGLIPLSALAAILIVVAYHMCEWRSFLGLLRSPRSDVMVLLTTFGLTVVIDLTIAIEVGMLISLLFFMKHMSEAVSVNALSGAFQDENRAIPEPEVWSKSKIPAGVEVFDVQGPLFFGAAQKFEESFNLFQSPPKVLIIRIREVLHIDSTGLHTLGQLCENCRRRGIVFILTSLHTQPMIAVTKSGLGDRIGKENLLPGLDAALERAKSIVGGEPLAA